MRGNALGGIEYRYPLMASTGSVTHVFEPIGQIIVRPNSVGDQQEIPNEDALSLVFDDTLLFDIDKFSGYDRIETGTRANVGMRYTAQLSSGTYARAVFGESYQLAGENEYDTDFFRSSGLATDRSDYVGGLYIQALSNLGFSAQSRFDESTWDIQRTDLGTFARYGPAQLRVNYADVIGEPGLAARRTTRGNCHGRCLGAYRGLVAARQFPLRPRDLDRRSPTAWACAIRTTASCWT